MRIITILGLLDGRDDLVYHVERLRKAFQNMSALLRFFEVKFRASADDLFPVV